jgi:hypothetical protein
MFVFLNERPRIVYKWTMRQCYLLSKKNGEAVDFFFLENAGELHFILLRRKWGKKSPNTIVTPLQLNYIHVCELEKRTTLLKPKNQQTRILGGGPL